MTTEKLHFSVDPRGIEGDVGLLSGLDLLRTKFMSLQLDSRFAARLNR